MAHQDRKSLPSLYMQLKIFFPPFYFEHSHGKGESVISHKNLKIIFTNNI